MAVDIYTKHLLLTDNNHGEDLTMNDLELAAYLVQLHLFALTMPPLKHIHTLVHNTEA